MRRMMGAVLLAVGFPGIAAAQPPQDPKMIVFGPTPPVRMQAQVDFIVRHLTDQNAIRALLGATSEKLQETRGSFSPGVYDAISVLARIPPDIVTDPALREQIVQVAQAARGNSTDTKARVDLIVPRFSVAARPLPPPLPPLAANPQPAPQVPAPGNNTQQASNDYVVALGKITMENGVSSGGRDNDYVSLTVIGPDGESGPFNSTLQTLTSQDKTRELNLRSSTVRVSNQSPSMRISWTAANHKDISNGQKTALALGKAAADLAKGGGFNPYVTIVGAIASVGLSLVKDCDAPLFGGAVVLYTDRLKDGEISDDWQPIGPHRWHREFDYPNIASPCATGHYKLDVDVERGG